VRRVHRNTAHDSGHPSAKWIISAWSRLWDKLDSVYFPVLQEEEFSWFIYPNRTKVVRRYGVVPKYNQNVNNKEKRSL